jgi:hypothetical protein
MVNVDESTALIIEHTVKKGYERRYEKWLAEILEAIRIMPGYIGREIFPPTSNNKPYIIIVRFQTDKNLQAWLDSPERIAFIRQMQDALTDGDRTSVKAGIDVWFMPDDSATKPLAYKQFLLTLAAIYPVTLIVPRLLAPIFEAVPLFKNPFVSGLIGNVIVVGLMTYLIMPHLTRWLHNWLFGWQQNKNDKSS